MEIEKFFLETRNHRLESIVNKAMVHHDAEQLLLNLKRWVGMNQHFPELIEMLCCKQYNISVFGFRSRIRKREFVDARKMFAYYFRIEKQVILRYIAEHLEKTHDSILFLVREFESLLDTDQETKDKYYNFLSEINEYKDYL